jgi:hypothetical protein
MVALSDDGLDKPWIRGAVGEHINVNQLPVSFWQLAIKAPHTFEAAKGSHQGFLPDFGFGAFRQFPGNAQLAQFVCGKRHDRII